MAASKVDTVTMPGSRQRQHLKLPICIVILVSLVGIFMVGAYVYPPRGSPLCYLFSSSCINGAFEQSLPIPSRDLTDEETAARVVMKEILERSPPQSKNPKVAFMFLTPGSLPFEKLWDKFLNGHEGRFSIYVHSSREKPARISPYFVDREIRSEKVAWGEISMIDAEKRLLAKALLDSDNQHFVLLSESCVPLHNFEYVYNYLIFTNVSFIDCFLDPGPHGSGRYSERMLPEIERKDFHKGSQDFSVKVNGIKVRWSKSFIHLGFYIESLHTWRSLSGAFNYDEWFSMKRQHAVIVMADSLYYTKFKLYCKRNKEGPNCYSDEHYFPTLFHMVDPGGIANWSITHVDWSEGKWHPKAYRTQGVTYGLLKNISSIDESVHVTSTAKKIVMVKPCLWNGLKRPCHLFARKFYPETLDRLMHIFSNYTAV